MMNILKHNLIAKILSFLAAIILWFYVMDEQNPYLENTMKVPIQIINSPEDCKINVGKKEVKFKMRGNRSVFISTSSENYSAYLNLHGYDEGKFSVKVETNLPKGAELISYSPHDVEVSIEKIITKKIPVTVEMTGELPYGVAVTRMQPEVKKVKIKGARSAVEQTKKLVAFVSFPETMMDFEKEVSLVAMDEFGKMIEGITIERPVIKVKVEMGTGIVKKILPIKADIATNLSSEYELKSVTVEPTEVQIEASATVIKDLKELETESILIQGETSFAQKIVKLKPLQGVKVGVSEVLVTIKVDEK